MRIPWTDLELSRGRPRSGVGWPIRPWIAGGARQGSGVGVTRAAFRVAFLDRGIGTELQARAMLLASLSWCNDAPTQPKEVADGQLPRARSGNHPYPFHRVG